MLENSHGNEIIRKEKKIKTRVSLMCDELMYVCFQFLFLGKRMNIFCF